MIEPRHPAAPAQLPWFITEPGQTDTLMVVTGAFLIAFTATMGALMFRLLYLPVTLVSEGEKAKYEVVAALCVIAMFQPGQFFWIAALLIAMTDFPDYSPLLRQIAGAVGRIAQSRKMIRTEYACAKREASENGSKHAVKPYAAVSLKFPADEVKSVHGQ